MVAKRRPSRKKKRLWLQNGGLPALASKASREKRPPFSSHRRFDKIKRVWLQNGGLPAIASKASTEKHPGVPIQGFSLKVKIGRRRWEKELKKELRDWRSYTRILIKSRKLRG